MEIRLVPFVKCENLLSCSSQSFYTSRKWRSLSCSMVSVQKKVNHSCLSQTLYFVYLLIKLVRNLCGGRKVQGAHYQVEALVHYFSFFESEMNHTAEANSDMDHTSE